MKITRIETFALKAPIGTHSFYSSQARFPERQSLLCRITTDDGLTGWGEGGQYGPGEPVASCIVDILGPRLLGRRADQPVRIWEEHYSFCRDFGRTGPYIEAMSAIDIALWDIWGQSLGLPVHALMGGAFRTKVPCYATGCYYPDFYTDTPRMMDALAEEVAGFEAAGITAIKIKLGLLPIADDTARIELIRKTVGDGLTLMADANHGYNAASALRIGRVMDKAGFAWFEEPVAPEDRDGYRQLRAKLDTPIAGGECEVTRWGFRDLIGGGCVDIAQPDLCCAGGFSEWQKIHAIAAAHATLIVPHVWGSGVAVAAALQAIATIAPVPHSAAPVHLQNAPMLEFDRTRNPLRDDILAENFSAEGGVVEIPNAPGLGIEMDEARMAQFVTVHRVCR